MTTLFNENGITVMGYAVIALLFIFFAFVGFVRTDGGSQRRKPKVHMIDEHPKRRAEDEVEGIEGEDLDEDGMWIITEDDS